MTIYTLFIFDKENKTWEIESTYDCRKDAVADADAYYGKRKRIVKHADNMPLSEILAMIK